MVQELPGAPLIPRYPCAQMSRWALSPSEKRQVTIPDLGLVSHVDLYPGRIIEKYDCQKLKLYNYP